MQSFRVLHIYKCSLPETTGGVEYFIDSLSRHTSKLGVDNSLLTLTKNANKEETLSYNGYTIHLAKQTFFIASTGFSISAFSKFKRLAGDADIIHYHFPNPFADILHFACRIKKPTIVTYHSDIIKQRLALKIYRPLKRLFLRSVDHIVATSPKYFATSDVLQRFSSKVSVIPIGIDINTYPRPSKACLAYWRNRLPKPFFLFIGAIRYYKGLHIALDAVANTDIQLAIAGINGIEQELKTHATSLNLNNVNFLGFVSDEDKVALLEFCTGFVFPSHLRSEAFGIALLEAAAFGKPLISCEIGTGTTFINIANKTGLVIPPGSSTELQKAMQYLLENPSVAAAMGARAKKRAMELFTAEQQAESYYNLYKKMLAEQEK